jgi:hypothetical protein
MKNVQKKASLISALLFIGLLACGEDESLLPGKWDSGGEVPSGFPNDLELFKDGSGICKGMSINWKVESNRFIITSSLRGFAFNYTVSDTMLILTDDNGQSAKYLTYLKKQEEKRAAAAKAEEARAAAVAKAAAQAEEARAAAEAKAAAAEARKAGK